MENIYEWLFDQYAEFSLHGMRLAGMPSKPPFLKEVAPPEAVTEDFTLQSGSPCGKTLGKRADVGIGPYGVSRCAGRFRNRPRSA